MIRLGHIHKIYKIIKSDISQALLQRNYEDALNKIDVYSQVAQRVNDIFRDDEIEKSLQIVAKSAIGIVNDVEFKKDKRIVFYDQIGTGVCLTLQYLRALVALGYKVLYIYENQVSDISSSIKDEVEKTCDTYLFYYYPYSIKNAKEIQRKIVEYGANTIIIHSPAYGAMGSAILYSLPTIRRIRVVPGDHHYYQGIDCIDRFFEFRNFGINVAIKKRNIPTEKIDRIMYYPIIVSKNKFQGFPETVNGKIIVAAAAAEYKFLGSDKFFRIVDYILSSSEDVVFLFLGNKNYTEEELRSKYNLNDRFLCLGYRTDFIECMKRIDIFVNSYPYSSALTSMTAAYFGKPIISFHDLVLEATCLNGLFKDKPLSFTDDTSLRRYIKSLINDSDYRRSEGEKIKELVETEDSFAYNLNMLLSEEQKKITYEPIDMDILSRRTEIYLNLQNTLEFSIFKELLYYYGIKTFLRFPFLLWQRATYRGLNIIIKKRLRNKY